MSSATRGSKLSWGMVAAVVLALGALTPNDAEAADARPAVKGPAADAKAPHKATGKKGKKGKKAQKGAAAAGTPRLGSAKPGSAKPRASGASEPRSGAILGGQRPGSSAAKPGVSKPQSQKPQAQQPLVKGASGGPKLQTKPASPRGAAKPHGQKPSVGLARPGMQQAGSGRADPHGQPKQTVSNSKPKAASAPKVQRANTFAVGARGGTLLSMPSSGVGIASDGGLGLAVRYRGPSFLGVEGSFMHYDSDNVFGADQGFPSDRSHNGVSGSVQLFLSPGALMSPYISVGGTWQSQAITPAAPDTSLAGAAQAETQNDVRRGLHGGLGLEFALGQHVGLGVEARYLGDAVHPASDPLRRGQVQGLAGLNIYF